MPIHNSDYRNRPHDFLLGQIAEGLITWETVARAFLYNCNHDTTNQVIEDQGLEPHQDCEVCHEYFSIGDLTVEEYSEVVCCESCLPQREEESRQEQLENGDLECSDCGQDQLDENGECPTCKNDPEY